MPQSIDEFDWGTTPLGPKDGWSPALRTTYDLMMGTGFAACATWGPEQTLIYNAAYIPFLGARHPWALGQSMPEVWHDVWDDIGPLVAKAVSGERVYMEDLHLVMTRNGFPEDTWWTFSYSPLRDGERIMGMIDIAVDTTPRVLAERSRAVVMAETTHRLKNTLSLVQAIARQSLKRVTDKEAVKGFDDRLQALASAHDALLQEDWDAIDLALLIEAALGNVIDRSRYELDGEPLAITAQAAQNVSLVIHELATNAIKYGAWSQPGGRIVVRWARDGERMRLEWTERGGPTPVRPERLGFGSKLVGRGLTGAGRAEPRFEPEGLSVVLWDPAESFV